MKKVILTLVLSFSFLFSFGNETKNNKYDSEFFNCWVEVTYVTTNPETFEATTTTWLHWVGYAGTQASCEAQAQAFVAMLE